MHHFSIGSGTELNSIVCRSNYLLIKYYSIILGCTTYEFKAGYNLPAGGNRSGIARLNLNSLALVRTF